MNIDGTTSGHVKYANGMGLPLNTLSTSDYFGYSVANYGSSGGFVVGAIGDGIYLLLCCVCGLTSM